MARRSALARHSSRELGEHLVELREGLCHRTRALDRHAWHLQTEYRERHRDAVIAARVDDPVVQRSGLDADRIGERLRASAEGLDAVRHDGHAVAFLLAGVTDAGE